MMAVLVRAELMVGIMSVPWPISTVRPARPPPPSCRVPSPALQRFGKRYAPLCVSSCRTVIN